MMHDALVHQSVQCPYCWEMIDILIDCSVEQQTYTEDCHVCCRPIVIAVSAPVDEPLRVDVSAEQD